MIYPIIYSYSILLLLLLAIKYPIISQQRISHDFQIHRPFLSARLCSSSSSSPQRFEYRPGRTRKIKTDSMSIDLIGLPMISIDKHQL
jgi:hypothetical protein